MGTSLTGVPLALGEFMTNGVLSSIAPGRLILRGDCRQTSSRVLYLMSHSLIQDVARQRDKFPSADRSEKSEDQAEAIAQICQVQLSG